MKMNSITELEQMISSASFGYFEYVGYLPHGITLIVLNKCSCYNPIQELFWMILEN